MISQVSSFQTRRLFLIPSKGGCSDTPELTVPAEFSGKAPAGNLPDPCWEGYGKGSVLLRGAALLSGNLPILVGWLGQGQGSWVRTISRAGSAHPLLLSSIPSNVHAQRFHRKLSHVSPAAGGQTLGGIRLSESSRRPQSSKCPQSSPSHSSHCMEFSPAAFNDAGVKLWQGREHEGWALAAVIQVWERLGSG